MVRDALREHAPALSRTLPILVGRDVPMTSTDLFLSRIERTHRKSGRNLFAIELQYGLSTIPAQSTAHDTSRVSKTVRERTLSMVNENQLYQEQVCVSVMAIQDWVVVYGQTDTDPRQKPLADRCYRALIVDIISVTVNLIRKLRVRFPLSLGIRGICLSPALCSCPRMRSGSGHKKHWHDHDVCQFLLTHV